MKVTALYVHPGGVYYRIPWVDPWDQVRDARLYRGPWPVVAHPPCARWSTLAFVNRARYGIPVGDDGGCFASALVSVIRFGGVLEHPAQSYAWKHYGIPRPRIGTWIPGRWGVHTTEVFQRNYGHRAYKRTWLLACKTALPALRWGEPPASDVWISCDRPMAAMRAASVKVMGKRERILTPISFRDLLLGLALSVFFKR